MTQGLGLGFRVTKGLGFRGKKGLVLSGYMGLSRHDGKHGIYYLGFRV